MCYALGNSTLGVESFLYKLILNEELSVTEPITGFVAFFYLSNFMAYTKATLADLQQSLADKISAGVVPSSSVKLAYWTRMLNDGQKYCADYLRLTKSASKTTAGASSTTGGTIAIGDDFISVVKVIDANDVELTQISPDDSAQYITSGGDVFWITGNDLDDYYLNTPTNDTYTIWYVYHVAKMVDTTDECIIADPVAVVCYAYSKLRMAQTDPLDDADKELGECNRRLDKIVSARITNDEGGLKFKMQYNA